MEVSEEVFKITPGYFVQVFSRKGEFLRHEFVAGDQVDFEDCDGNKLDDIDPSDYYYSFHMDRLVDQLVGYVLEHEHDDFYEFVDEGGEPDAHIYSVAEEVWKRNIELYELTTK